MTDGPHHLGARGTGRPPLVLDDHGMRASIPRMIEAFVSATGAFRHVYVSF